MKTSVPLVCLILLLGSCRSAPAPTADAPRPSPYLLTPEQARHHGLTATSCEPGLDASPPNPLAASAVEMPADVKAYVIGRTVDPRDPALLHEAHVMYRRETSPRWRLQAPTDQRILIGPQLTDGGQDAQPLLTKELTAFLNEQRRANQSNESAIAALFQAVERLAEQQRVLAERSRATAAPERTVADAGGPVPLRALETLSSSEVKED